MYPPPMSNRLQPPRTFRDRMPVQQPPEPSGKPQLIWSSIKYGQGIESHDAFRFPDISSIRSRHTAGHNGTVLKLLAFEEAVCGAIDHILVLDPHFDEKGAKVLGPALEHSQVLKVHLLTGRGDVDQTLRKQLRKDMMRYCNMNRSGDRRVEVQWDAILDKSHFPFLHDRFAIIDGAVWHFGSTVGGGHKGLTAASGPWSATETRAMEFFEECWRLCNARSAP